MIRVNDDWIIDVDDHNYILKRDRHRTYQQKQKEGTYKEVPAYETVSYHPTALRALERLGEEIIREKLKGPEMCLHEAVVAIRECTEEWRELVRLVNESTGGNQDE